MTRTPIVAGNWKMNGTVGEALLLARAVREGLAGLSGVEVAVCPPFTALRETGQALQGSRVALGGQDMHWEASGAFTGEISAAMLLEAGCAHVILGHSERRHYFGETDEAVNRKTRAALAAGLKPIVCVGETQAEREADRTMQVVETQVRGGLAGLGEDDWADLVVAYEPVWAIGTGLTATPEQAQDVHQGIRAVLADLAGAAIADGVRIQYGGSVKPSNAAELFGKPDIDGGLIGGAALDADSFVRIVRAAAGEEQGA